MHVLLGFGFTSFAMLYSFSDGVRFLGSHIDKFLYLISCVLQKPILLPVLMPKRFKSKIALKHSDKYSFKLQGAGLDKGLQIATEKVVQPTNFLLAV